MLRTWCVFAGLCAGGALSGTTSPLRGSCRRKRRGEPTTKDTPCGVCALSGTTSPLWGSCRLRRGEPTTKDTPCGVYALSGATSPLGGSCRRKRRGEPTSVISDSFSPTSSFGCGSSPESATKENEECKSIPHFLGAPMQFISELSPVAVIVVSSDIDTVCVPSL